MKSLRGKKWGGGGGGRGRGEGGRVVRSLKVVGVVVGYGWGRGGG